jgi:hypothetical protein
MAKVLESLIAKGRRARRPPEQKEVAFGLADLSTHGTYSIFHFWCIFIVIYWTFPMVLLSNRGAFGKTCSKGWCKITFDLVDKVDRYGCSTVCSSYFTLYSQIILAFNRTRMASEGAIPILIDYMKNTEGDLVAKQYCAMALGNLAAEPENHMEVVKSEGTRIWFVS